MTRRDEGIFELLSQVPWWIGLGVTAFFYVTLRFIIPSLTFEDPILKAMPAVAAQFAWFSFFLLFPVAYSAFESLRKRRLLDCQTGIESIRCLEWKEFEELVAEAYRRQGYAVQENPYRGPDGGIDLRIQKNGNFYLVQCKRWRSWKVDIDVVQDMHARMCEHHATGVIVVTCGMFTQRAKTFAADKPIDLVEGNQLVQLVGHVQGQRRTGMGRDESASAPRRCPQCGRELVMREARRGAHAGSKFLGCSGFPECRYIAKCDGKANTDKR